MKVNIFLIALSVALFASCSSVRVATDYDTAQNFNRYKTFAFYKKGIDKAGISDLDKKRIMRAIEAQLLEKGMQKSDSPDVLVSLFTKSKERVTIDDGFYGGFYGGFYYPWYYGPSPMRVSTYTEGTLFIDLIDTQTKELVWQGIGAGAINTRNPDLKTKRINEFVAQILTSYPPKAQKK